MLPDAESLRCFVAAAEQLNFRSAARRVALSPAAFGGRIKQLEEQLGAALFARTTRKVASTPAGERLLPHARSVLLELARCTSLASDERAPFSLPIGTRFELGMSWLVPSLSALERARPERQLHVYFGDTADLAPKVLRQELDCMVTSARLSAPGLTHAPLHEEHYALVAARGLLASARCAARLTPRRTCCSMRTRTCRCFATSSTRGPALPPGLRPPTRASWPPRAGRAAPQRQ